MEGEGDEGEHQHHGEKKSVLKKVKDKAKKVKDKAKEIKDTIKKHGHGLEDEHEGGRQCHMREEGDDEDSPEVHTAPAPMVESTVIRIVDLPRETNTNLEKPTDRREDRYEHDASDQGLSRPSSTPGHRAPGHAPDNKSTMPPSIEREKPKLDEQKPKIEPPQRLKEDQHFPECRPADVSPPDYQSKATDATVAGDREADVAPLAHQLDNLHVPNDSESKQRPDTGSHDQFAPQSTPTENQCNPELNPKSQDPANTEDMPQDTIAGKISSAASVAANKAVSATNIVASKLGYGSSDQEGQDSTTKPISESASEYVHKVAETLAPVYDKVAGASTAALSKVHGSGGTEHQGRTNKGASIKEYLSEKFKPGDEDKELSEMITNALGKKNEEHGQMGKVTESDEVAARLGRVEDNKREGLDAMAAGQESSGQGMVDRLKDAVGKWLGKSTGMQTAQDSVSRSYVNNASSKEGR